MKAVIPAAGLGTRFLPATKAQPKEMLPVVDKPVIQYVVEEAVASGIEDILIITNRKKGVIEDHFKESPELEELIKGRQEHKHLSEVRELINSIQIRYVKQERQLGLGHAIHCAREKVNNQPFAVLLGDTITITSEPCIRMLGKIFAHCQSTVIAIERVPAEKIGCYGIVDVEKIDEKIYKVKGLVEKPALGDAPSNFAICGRYILTPEIFECLAQIKPDKNSEIQLTDALTLLLKKQDIYALEISGKRYDIGSKIGWLEATIELALKRDDLGEDLKHYLKKLISSSGDT